MYITLFKKILMAIVKKFLLIAIGVFGCYVIVITLMKSEEPGHIEFFKKFESKIQTIKEKKHNQN